MGSDLCLNPPPPPPIHEQVQALVERNEEMRDTIAQLQVEKGELKEELAMERRFIKKYIKK